jgi:hypothetical protein
MRWARFVKDWNATLLRRPQTVVSTFLASQSSTWMVLYGGVTYVLPAGLLAPELAVGWMASRLTRKFRQPLNFALSAAIVRVVPAVSELKVTALITGVAPDKQARDQWQRARARVVERLPFMDTVFNKGRQGLEWLNGPVDKYGLAFYLAGKVTSLSTLLATAAVVRQGVDVVALLAGWGLTGEFSDALANLAGSGAMNVAFTPAHFGLAVYGTHAQEALAGKLVEAQATLKKQQQRQAESRGEKTKTKEKEKAGAGEEEREEEDEEEEFEFDDKSVLGGMSMLLLVWTLMVTAFAMNEMKRTSTTKADGESAATTTNDGDSGTDDSLRAKVTQKLAQLQNMIIPGSSNGSSSRKDVKGKGKGEDLDPYFDGPEFEPPQRHVTVKESDLAAPIASGKGRLIFVGDVHGCFDELMELLYGVVQYDEGSDTVVLVGDLVNKGPRSLDVLAWAREKGVLAVRGNHDDAALAAALGRGSLYDKPSSPAYARGAVAEKWRWAKEGLLGEDLAWLRALPFTLSFPFLDPPLLAVHAGVLPGVPLEQQARKTMTSMRNVLEAEHRILNDGENAGASATSATTQRHLVALEKPGRGEAWAKVWSGPEHAIFGHDAKRGLQREAFATGLDTGCCFGRQLTARVFPSGEFFSVDAREQYVVPASEK